MAGITEIIGRLPVPRGAYSSGSTYYKYNLVTLFGSTYMCRSDGITSAPATKADDGKVTVNENWEVWADASQVEYISGLVGDVLRDLGKYPTSISLPMSVGVSGKYVDPDGQEKSNSALAISVPVSLKAGNIYMLASSSSVGTGVSVFARQVTNTYDKVIVYTEQETDSQGRPTKVVADYDANLVYTITYDSDGNATYKDSTGGTIASLPTTHEVTESFYEPLFRTNDSSMPESGHYLYLCPQDMDVVISAKSVDIAGKSLTGVRYGAFASIMTNFVSNFGQKVIAQAIAELYAAVQGLSAQVDKAGHLKVDVLDQANLPLVCGEEMYTSGEGAPGSPPTVPFQEYYDSTNGKFYKAKGVLPDSPTVSDWVALN